ncbi:MAG: hypothetical protein KIS92_08880 [Planctomycetota bacterium]|nr:hypothetical protein [Planctomycetota bacterium]
MAKPPGRPDASDALTFRPAQHRTRTANRDPGKERSTMATKKKKATKKTKKKTTKKKR